LRVRRRSLDGHWPLLDLGDEPHRRAREDGERVHEGGRGSPRRFAGAARRRSARGVGIDDADRDTSPFAHREDIASVDTLTAPSGPKANAKSVEGAVVTFRAVPGMTEQWLQRVVDCHVARNAAMGHDAPDMAFCPLATKGVTATVSPTRDGFAVAIRASDPTTASEVVRRAQALRAPR